MTAISMLPRTATALASAALGVLLVCVFAPASQAQFQNKWLSAGSLHNWYSEIGSECEECGFIRDQQDGWRWPGIYRFTDMQAAKGLWIGAQNVRGPEGTDFPVRVVHVGPRVSGSGEFFPVRFETVSKFPLPTVTVDGNSSFSSAEMVVDRTDPDQLPDVMIVNEVNSLLGITMERRIMQFSQGFHDDYHVIEHVFTNTGNTDADSEIELPDQTLEGVYFFFQYRLAPTANTRYAMGNETGWGRNTMNDARGDGVREDPADEQFRAQFSWHGFRPDFSGGYNNLGGPLMPPVVPATNVAPGDTVGRLGAHQFAGVVTLHADASATNDTDDTSQPGTTTWFSSDAPLTSNNDPFSPAAMRAEYDLMSGGNKSPRHAYSVEPTGLPGFIDPTAAPHGGDSGGFSFANGYGPYTLAPGESVRIVFAEATGGLSREAATEIGKQFKDSGGDSNASLTYEVDGSPVSMTKNEWVFTSRDSLFQTFRRALASYEAGYDIPQPPAPPSSFAVAGGGDRITLSWETQAGESDPPGGWEIYRAQARFDSTYTLIYTASPGERSYDDTTPIRGIDYYYYLVGVGDRGANDGSGMTPAGVPLRSSRYYTQAFLPTQLKRQQGTALDQVRIVPNPFNLGSTPSLRFPDQTDKLAFYNIPGLSRIDIYTELGQLVDTIEHTDGSGDEFWDHTTASRQTVVSGLYIAVITVTEDIFDSETGAQLFSKGERAIKKFVIIR